MMLRDLTEKETSDLYTSILGWMISELSDNSTPESRWDAVGKRSEYSILGEITRMPCDWCNATGDFLGGPCYFCHGSGQTPTVGGWRKFIEALKERRLSSTRARSLIQSAVSGMKSLTPQEWSDFQEKIKTEDPTHPMIGQKLAKEIKRGEKEIKELDEEIEQRDDLLESLTHLARLSRLASRAVQPDVTLRTHRRDNVPPPVVEAPTCCVCGRDATITGTDDQSYCKRHGYQFIRRMPEESEQLEEAKQVISRGNEPEKKRRKTRPFRFRGGPADGELHSVERGETEVEVNGGRYSKRGHAFEWIG